MAKPTISSYLRDHLDDIGTKKEPGPYITLSRQWGCGGVELGELLIAKLNERDPEQRWKLYQKELLKQLAEDTGLTEEILDKERKSKPSLLKDFLRGLKKNAIPDCYEIRNKITMMVRTIAFEGHAIILGQGGTAATGDLANGLSVRVEAPRDWRVARICRREGLEKQAAIARIEEIEEERDRRPSGFGDGGEETDRKRWTIAKKSPFFVNNIQNFQRHFSGQGDVFFVEYAFS